MIFRLPFVLHMRQTHDKVVVSEIRHRNVKGSLLVLCVLTVFVFPSVGDFSEAFINWPVSMAS